MITLYFPIETPLGTLDGYPTNARTVPKEAH